MGDRDIRFYEYYLKPGYIFLNREPSNISTVVGSCVAVSLWGCKGNYGGMAHYLYPFADNRDRATAKYGNVAINHLIKIFLDWDADRRDVGAQIFGGASLRHSTECEKIAQENIRVARCVLERSGIKIISEDVGGDMGRKVIYNTYSNEAIVYKTERLRGSDWYPYSHER
jgi:chemotaxis protein CheD